MRVDIRLSLKGSTSVCLSARKLKQGLCLASYWVKRDILLSVVIDSAASVSVGAIHGRSSAGNGT